MKPEDPGERAWKEFLENVAEADKIYREVRDQLDRSHEDAVTQAKKSYWEAIARAWKIYEEGRLER